MFAIHGRTGRGRAALFALCLLSLTLCASGAISIPELPKEKRSDKKKKEIPRPPQPVPVAVEVTNGGTVQIPLRIYGKQEQTTAFLVRKGPALGKVISLSPLEAEVWVLTYQHTAAMTGEARMQDRILFAAQNKNGTSAAAEIVLNIVDTPPELVAPGEPVEFGEIAAGLPAVRIVKISNKGGGLLEGTAMVEAPWTVEPANFKLRHGEEALFQLILVPDSEREYEGRLHFVVGETHAQPTLHANAFAPFTVEPATLELTPGPARSGTLTLTNRTATALTVAVEANPRLGLPGQIVLQPRKTETFRAELAQSDPEAIDTTLRFTVGAISKPVQIHAKRLPKVSTPTPAPSATPQLQRTTPAPIKAATPLPPPAHLGGDAPGHNAPALETESKGVDTFLMDAVGQPKLPILKGVKVLDIPKEGIAEITWPPMASSPALPGGASNYRLEARTLSIDSKGKPVQNWNALQDVQCTKKSDSVTARIGGVPPGLGVTLRVVALNPQGEPCAASHPVRFTAPAPTPIFTLRRGLLAGLSLLLLAALGLKWLKNR